MEDWLFRGMKGWFWKLDEQHATQHYLSLDFLKIIGTFIIIFGHYQMFMGVQFEHINFSRSGFPVGQTMVYLFFVISGVLMQRYIAPIANGEVSFYSFMGKRVIRLMPMTAITAVAYEIAILIFHCLTGTSWQAITSEMGIEGIAGLDVFAMLASMAGVSAGWFYQGPMVNGVTWYISVLILLYIVFWCSIRVAAHLGTHSKYAFIIMVFIGILIWHFRLNIPFFNIYSAKGYICFFIGAFIGQHIENGIQRTLASFGYLGFIMCVVCVVYVYYKAAKFTDQLFLMIVGCPSLIILCLTEPIRSVFHSRMWGKLGAITFDVYVWHYILIILLRALNSGLNLNLPYDSRWFMILFALFCFVFGGISYFYLEKNWKNLFFCSFKNTETYQ